MDDLLWYELESLIWTWTETEKTIYYYHKDHQWSVIWLSNLSGDMIQEYHYDDYGTPYLCEVGSIQCTSITSLDDTYGNDRFYTGREYDRETGLYYYRARYYSPYLGRFISRDPIGTADNINLYSYVGSNPLNYTDPSGNVAGVANAIAWGVNVGIWYAISLFVDGYDYDWRVDGAIDFSAWFAWYGLVKNVAKLRFLWKTGRIATVLGWDIILWVWTDYSKQYLHNPWEKFSLGESTFDNIVWVGVSSAWTYGVGRLFKGVFGENVGKINWLQNSIKADLWTTFVWKKPYSKGRPSYSKWQVDEVWEKSKWYDWKVRDPNTWQILAWNKSKSRNGQWDMGHKPKKEYRKLHKEYMNWKISLEEFKRRYRDSSNYLPEHYSPNRSRKYESK